MKPAERYPTVLLLAFGAAWTALAIAPSYRQDWLLENALIFIAVPLLVATSRTLRFSNTAYTCMFVFFYLHAIGAHYTYSEVPWREWLHLQDAGTGPGSASRNNFDRFVHSVRVADVPGGVGTVRGARQPAADLALRHARDIPHGAFGHLRVDRMGRGGNVRRRPRRGVPRDAGR